MATPWGEDDSGTGATAPSLPATRTQERLQIGKLCEALSKAQGEMKPPEKTGRATIQGGRVHRYAELGGVIDAIREPFAKNGLSFTQILKGGSLVTILMHTSGEYITSSYPLPNPANMGRIQDFGAALTYAKRYSLQAIVGLNAEDDPDGPGDDQKGRQSPPPPKTTPPKADPKEVARKAQEPLPPHDATTGELTEPGASDDEYRVSLDNGKQPFIEGMLNWAESARSQETLDAVLAANAEGLTKLNRTDPNTYKRLITVFQQAADTLRSAP